MRIEIGKRYNIETKELNYINYQIINIIGDKIQIHSIDGGFELKIDEITDIEKLNIFQCLTTIPKRTKEINIQKKENKEENIFHVKTVYYKPTEERKQQENDR